MVDPDQVEPILSDAARLIVEGEIVVFGSAALAFWLRDPPSSRDVDLWCEPLVRIHAQQREGRSAPEDGPLQAAEVEVPIVSAGYREEVLGYLQNLKPAAFERFCADLLKQFGLERVQVTGGTGDQGIDGEGYLPVGSLVTTKIAFQCKRYAGAVSAKEVREFQGALGSRAEKGLFFTTGYFTDGATAASRMPTSIPVELIDGDRLVDLLEQREFGLKAAKTFALDYEFLTNYPKESRGLESDVPRNRASDDPGETEERDR